MSAYTPPTYNVTPFNPAYFTTSSSSGITESEATALFLKKTAPDTATALETFTAGIATNSIAPAASATNMTISSSAATGAVIIDTGKTSSTNADPAIGIGTSNIAKVIKIGNSNANNSVHIGSLDIAGSSLNTISGDIGAISIGNLQSTGTIEIGGLSSRTGAITIGSVGTTNVLPITIGCVAPTATVTIRNPMSVMKYTAIPTYTSDHIGYQYYLSQSASGLVSATLSADTTLFTQNITVVGKYLVTYGTRITATSTTVGASVTYFSTWINQSAGFPTNYPLDTGVFSLGVDATRAVGTSTTGIPDCIGSNGSAVVTVTSTTNIALKYRIAASTPISFFNAAIGQPSNYLMITRIG